MPTLHIQAIGQAQTPDGKVMNLHPAVALQARGPVLQVAVTIEENAGKALVAAGKTLPDPKSGFALIDTGASNTCIDEQAAKDLGLPVIDQGSMLSATHEKVPCNIYPVRIITPILTLNCPRTASANLSAHQLLIIIGRDVLQGCTLFYKGGVGQYTLSM